MKQAGLAYLDSLPFWKGGLDFDLEATRLVLAELDNPQDSVRSVHIAGTNGKGSTAAFIANILAVDSYKVLQFASPHLSDVTERIIIDGFPVQADILASAIDKVVGVAERLNIELTYFEVVTVCAFCISRDLGVDFNVVEVGLGGRLDATNVLAAPDVTVISGIAMDHVEALGDSLVRIAGEKAGIIKPNVPVFVGCVSSDVRQVFIDVACERQSPIFFFGEDFSYNMKSVDVTSGEFEMSGSVFSLKVATPYMQGAHQLDNALLAVAVAKSLGISIESIEKGLTRTIWPGRLERLSYYASAMAAGGHGSGEVVIDAAHNAEGIEKLALSIADLLATGKWSRIVLVLAFLERKEWRDMIGELNRLISSLDTGVSGSLFFARSRHAQSVEPQLLLDVYLQEMGGLDKRGCDFSASTIEGSEKIVELVQREKDSGALVVLAGSIYFIGELRRLLGYPEFTTAMSETSAGENLRPYT